MGTENNLNYRSDAIRMIRHVIGCVCVCVCVCARARARVCVWILAWMEGEPEPRTVHAARSTQSCLHSEREMALEPTEESGWKTSPQAFSAWFTAHIYTTFWTQGRVLHARLCLKLFE